MVFCQKAPKVTFELYTHTIKNIRQYKLNLWCLTPSLVISGISYYNYNSPSMRPRHWKQVLKLARSSTSHFLSRGGTFDVSLLEELTFGQFLDMTLHGECFL